jgi:alpha/beta hydrolase family protein
LRQTNKASFPTRLWRFLPALVTFLLLTAPCAMARVMRVVIDPAKSESPALGGKSFGAGIVYERIAGLIYGEIDPKDPHNALIQDIALAPRNPRGHVEYVATFTLLKPIEMAKASGVLIYEVVNRGASIVPRDYSSGDVFLFSGWQGDIPFGGKSISGLPGETIRVPTALNPDGSPVTGPVLARFSNMAPGLNTLPVRAATSYNSSGVPPEPVDLDTAHATLTTHSYESVTGAASPETRISNDDWAWADCSVTPFPGKPDPTKICLRSGFDSHLLYQLIYQGKNPLVLGVGLAATRDINSFFRYAAKDEEAWANPIFGHAQHALGVGASQSGNLIRTFLNLAFNQDEEGRVVWDGAMPTIAARQTPMNVRFAIPGGASNLYELGSDGVVWWADWPDPLRHHPTAGLLTRCTATHSCPRIIELLGSSEFWSLRASPDFVGTDNRKDIPLPSNVRRYYVASTQHGGGRGGFHAGPVAPPPARPAAATAQDPLMPVPCAFPMNSNPMEGIRKALLVALKDWIVRDVPPPPSRYPTLADGTLVAANRVAMGFPTIPGVPSPDSVVNPLLVYDLGDQFDYNDLTGVVPRQPLPIRDVIQPLVPRVDSDGNEVGGIHTVLQQAALGTYLGWNLAASGFTKGQYCSLAGSYFPFAATKAERLASYDPRPSLEERYGTQEGYVCVVKKAASGLVSERLLLREDADQMVGQAEESGILPGSAASSDGARRIADARCAGTSAH